MPLGGDRESRSVQVHADEGEGWCRCDTILIFIIDADSTEQVQLSHLHRDGATMGEVPPTEATVVFDGLHDVAEDFVAITVVLEVQGVEALASRSPHLAQGVGDISIAQWAPSADQPGQRVGVVPRCVVVPVGVSHGKTEVLDQRAISGDRLDQATALPELHRRTQSLDDIGQVYRGLTLTDHPAEGKLGYIQEFWSRHVFSTLSSGCRSLICNN